MPIRADQDQPGFIKRGSIRIGDVLNPQWYGAGFCGVGQGGSVRRIIAETQQHKTMTEQIQRRPPIIQPPMGCAGAGPGGLVSSPAADAAGPAP